MGFTPQQVGEMSMWQFMACIEGYAEVHGGKKPGLSDKDFDELSDMVDQASA